MMQNESDGIRGNPRGQAPGRTSFLTRFSHVLRRYQPRGVGLSDEVSQWRCRRETIRLRQGYGGQERSRRSSGWTPADAYAQTSLREATCGRVITSGSPLANLPSEA